MQVNNFEPNDIKFLIDSVADMNLIKLSALKVHALVNEGNKKSIKRINSIPVSTIGSVNTPMSINEKVFKIKLNVVLYVVF